MKSDFSDGMRLSGKGRNEMVLICDEPFLLRSFPEQMAKYLEVVGEERHYDLEDLGGNFRQNGFDYSDASEFTNRVCKWGGYAGIAARVLSDNGDKDVVDAFNKAAGLVSGNNVDIPAAIKEVDDLDELALSYASKHLRMLRPQKCVSYDKFLKGRLSRCYPYNHENYAVLCCDFQKLASVLKKRGICNKSRARGVWYAADVEATVFYKVYYVDHLGYE